MRYAGLLCLVTTGCARYNWVPDYEIPEICPPAKVETVPPPTYRLELRNGAVTGRVVSQEVRAPLGRSRVMIVAPAYRVVDTDTTGVWRLDSMVAGTYTLRIVAIGYRAWQGTVAVAPETLPPFEVALRPDVFDGPCSGFEMVRIRKKSGSR